MPYHLHFLKDVSRLISYTTLDALTLNPNCKMKYTIHFIPAITVYHSYPLILIDGHLLKFIHYGFSVQEEYKDKCRFLYGESMGGAVALLLHKKDPAFWNGAILVAPMCKVYV